MSINNTFELWTELMIFLRDITIPAKKISTFTAGVIFPSIVVIACSMLNENVSVLVSVSLTIAVFLVTSGTHFFSWKIVEQLIQGQKTDELTGLYNERGFILAFHERCSALAAEYRPVKRHDPGIASTARDRKQSLIRVSVAFVYMDLDHFKSVNDRFGHGVGDDILKETASILRRAFRDLDLVARLHGDEFAIVVTGMGSDMLRERAEATIEAIRSDLSEYMDAVGLPEEGKALTATMGICFSHTIPESGRVDYAAISKLADHALLEAKRAGKNRAYITDVLSIP